MAVFGAMCPLTSNLVANFGAISLQQWFSMPESFVIVIILITLTATVALNQYVSRYHEAEIVVTNGTANSILSGAYLTHVNEACNMADCSVKSFRKNCNLLGLITSCYLINCNNGVLAEVEIKPGNATMDHQCPRGTNTGGSNGIIIPATDIKQMITRLYGTIDHKDSSFPVIVIHYKDAYLLSATGVTFNVTVGDDQQAVSHSVTSDDHTTHSGSPNNIHKRPFYFAALFLILLVSAVTILVTLSAVGISALWMCGMCAEKKYIKSYIKVMVNVEQGDEGISHCCICLEDYKTNDVIGVLPCEHEYHKQCIHKWLVKHSTCPLCKSDILMDKKYENSPVAIDHEASSSPAAAMEIASSAEITSEVVEINFEVTEL